MLITGASGRVGTELCQRLGEDDIIAKPRETLDIANEKMVNACIGAVRPDIVINTAAITNAQGDLQSMWNTNVLGVANLVKACAENGVPLVHITTGDVFGGFYESEPRVEHDETMCLSPYLQSRLAGEHAFLQSVHDNLAATRTGFRYWLIRSSLLYSSAQEFRGGFIHELLRKAAVRQTETKIADDVMRSPTYIPHFVDHLIWLIENRRDVPSGIYHIANKGNVSLYDIAHFVLMRVTHSLQYDRCDHPEQARLMGISWMALARAASLDCDRWDRICPLPLLDWRVSMEEFLMAGSASMMS